MALKDTLWMLPFLFFIAGYFSLSMMYRTKKIIAPTLIGLSIQEAFERTSNNGLNLRLIDQREDAELPEGTIISQNPTPFSAVKPNQTLFCTISKQPVVVAPHLIGSMQEQVLHKLKELGIHGRCYLLESNYPKGYCFVQSPKPQTKLDTKMVTLYVSSGKARPILFPNLKDKPVQDVIEFLKPYGITPTIIHSPPIESHTCSNSCFISNQRPVPGTIVTLAPEKPLQVQLQVYYQPTS